MTVDRGRIIRETRQIGIQFELLANQAVAQKGLTTVQARILLHILTCSENGTSLTHIQRKSGYSKAALCDLVKQLKKKGYVRVEPCAQDNRRKLLFGTDKGAHVQEFLARSISGVQDHLFQGFSQEEIETLDRLQRKLLQNLSAMKQNGSDNGNDNKEVSKS